MENIQQVSHRSQHNQDWIVAQEILTKVHEVCCFGSMNKRVVLQSRNAFEKLLYGVSEILSKKTIENVCASGEVSQNEFREIDKKKKNRMWPLPNRRGSSLKYGSTFYYLAPVLFFEKSSVVLKAIRQFYSIDLFKWNKEALQHLRTMVAWYMFFDEDLAQIASEARNWSSAKKEDALLAEQKKLSNYENGNEPKGDEDRFNFVKWTARSAKNASFYYGWGNCGLMADIAFLEAIIRKIPATYIRFVNHKGEFEEVNCLALGDWPEPDCLIISPWQDGPNGEKGKIFEWRGSVHETLEVATSYHECKVLFQLSQFEIEKYSKYLDRTLEYSSWLDASARQNNLKRVDECAVLFEAALFEQGFVKPEALNDLPSPAQNENTVSPSGLQ